MSTVPTPQQLAQLDNPQLDALALEWRVRAARGENEAFGVAHVLEVEQRARLRAAQAVQDAGTDLPVTPRTWWQRWTEGPDVPDATDIRDISSVSTASGVPGASGLTDRSGDGSSSAA